MLPSYPTAKHWRKRSGRCTPKNTEHPLAPVSRIPVTLITGFLGSGKTTLLRRIAQTRADRKLLFLVNEFASEGIDPSLLDATGVPILSVVGGSLFCRCKVETFIAHLKTLPEKFATELSPVDHLYIETSGLADPGFMQQLLEETRLDDRYAICGICAVVVPSRFLALQSMLPVIRAQVSCASQVLLNKTDLCSCQDLQETEACIRALNPHAAIHRTCYCDCLPEAEASSLPTANGMLSPGPNPFETRVIELKHPMDPKKIADSLGALGDRLYRAKGFFISVQHADRWSYLDWTREGWSARAVEVRCYRSSLVLLFHASDTSMYREIGRLEALFHQP
jgi:G3E family GTPase